MAACRLKSTLLISREQQYKHGVGNLDYNELVWNTS